MADVCPIEDGRIRLPRESKDDPTELTTKQLLREIEIVYALIDDKVASRQREGTAMKEMLEGRIQALKEIVENRFNQQKNALDERFATSVKALDAAMASADKAVDRERDSNNKRFVALESKTTELSSRMDLDAGGNKTSAVDEVTKRFNMVFTVSIVSTLIAIAAVLVGVLK